MAVKRCEASIDVVEAAKMRIRNVFRNGLPVYMSFSGGKDSLVMAQLVVELIQSGEIKPAQLTVQFIDEEAIFSCIEEKVKEWRKKFLLLGARFEWFCLEVKHFNCFNELSNDETFYLLGSIQEGCVGKATAIFCNPGTSPAQTKDRCLSGFPTPCLC